mmetsp:Transcript_31567/g.77042  ORF Transcript_31567/g.77042 Transcript_31567/m.77042 type:complete len:216 (-) Transcript_31567:3854-4501(-)
MVVQESGIKKACTKVLDKSSHKIRNFIENIELMISLKPNSNKKHKKLSGSVFLPYPPKTSLRICILADEKHASDSKSLGIYYLTIDKIKKLKGQKKLIKKLVKRFEKFLASDTIIKLIPRYLGPELTKYGKFPTAISHSDNLKNQIKKSLNEKKISFKKDFNSGIIVGNIKMAENEVIENFKIVCSFILTLLSKKINMVKTIVLKRTMGAPIRIK